MQLGKTADVIDDRCKGQNEGTFTNDGDIRKRLEKVSRINHGDITGGYNGVIHGDIEYLMSTV